MIRLLCSSFVLLLMMGPLPTAAQPGGPRGLMPHRPAFLDHVFRPEQIMQYQEAIGLSDDQRRAITETLGATQQRLVELRWKFEAESQALSNLLDVPKIDEDAAMAQAKKVMVVEEEMKNEHLRLLIRIKNQLTAEQQAKLEELSPKRERGFRRGPRPRDNP